MKDSVKTKVLCSSIALIGFLTAAANVGAHPFVFEREYTNYAWGYQHNGCLVDESGNIYKYDITANLPVSRLEKKVPPEDLKASLELLNKASKGVYKEEHRMADAGIRVWKGTMGGKTVKLKQWGDYTGKNLAPEAEQLAGIIDSWCK